LKHHVVFNIYRISRVSASSNYPDLMAGDSSETSVYNRPHSATSQNTVVFTTMRNSDLMFSANCERRFFFKNYILQSYFKILVHETTTKIVYDTKEYMRYVVIAYQKGFYMNLAYYNSRNKRKVRGWMDSWQACSQACRQRKVVYTQ